MKVEMNHNQLKNDVNRPSMPDVKSRTQIGLIEWNVDMNVTVGNVKRSKIFQRTRILAILVLAVTFAIMLSHVKKEMRSLQEQINFMNANVLMLMSKYDRLNRNLNRIWIHRPTRFHRTVHPKYFTDLDKNNMEKNHTKLSVFEESIYKKDIVPSSNEHRINRDGNSLDPKLSSSFNMQFSSSDQRNPETDNSLKRHERSVVSMINKNFTLPIEREENETNYEEIEEDEMISEPRETRSGRSRRDNEGRGKQNRRKKNKRRPNRSRRRLGPLVATFVGAIPEQKVTDTVYIGPWVRSIKNDSQYNLNKFHLVEDRKSIEVTANGLYMISVQIFYFGESTNYSYWILLNSEGSSTTQKLVKCATAIAPSATEVSCHTSIVIPLRRGDRLHIQQQERDRLINLREGHSFMQLVLLSNSNGYKRRLT